MRVILNGIEKDYTREEIEYLKKHYGDWEKHQDTFVFNKVEFLTVEEMERLLPISQWAIYQRNHRNPRKYPLVKKGNILGIDADKFLSKWI